MATTNLTTTSSLSAKMAVYYDRLMLDRLREQLVFNQFGTKKRLPKNSGKRSCLLLAQASRQKFAICWKLLKPSPTIKVTAAWI